MLGTPPKRKCMLLTIDKASPADHHYLLQPRDLRKIDSRIPNLVPTILVRKEAFLVCVNSFSMMTAYL